jgi:hypothetical protein
MNSVEIGSTHPDLALPVAASDIAHHSRPWYVAYMAALFEPDGNRMAEQIRQAEILIIAREREMFSQNLVGSERAALGKAFYALRGLRFCIKTRS